MIEPLTIVLGLFGVCFIVFEIRLNRLIDRVERLERVISIHILEHNND